MVDRSIVARLRADISDFKSKMADAKKSAQDVGSGAEAGAAKSTSAFGRMLTSVNKNKTELNGLASGSAKMGLVLAAGVGLAVKSFADFDKQMSAVAATGTDARENLQQLRDVAVKAGADTAFSAGEAAEGIENLLKAGVSAKDVIGGGLAGALSLAAAGSISVGDAAETAATAMTQFKLSGKDVPHIADLLAAGAGKAQGEVSDLAMALKQSGLVASQFGLSLEDTTGTLAAFASAGLIGSDAGTSFKTMLLALANPAAKTQKLMTELGISAYDAQGNFVGITNLADQLKTHLSGLTQAQRDSALAQIFGNDAIRAANVLYDQGGAGISDWIAKTNDAGYAAEVAATKMDNLSGDLEYLRGSIDSTFIKSGSGANTALRSLVQTANDLVNAVGNLPAPVLEGGLKVAALGAAGLLAFAGVVKMATGVATLRASLLALAPAGSAAAGSLAAVRTAAGSVLAVLAVAAAAQILVEKFKPAAATMDETTLALRRVGNGSSTAKDDLDSLFQSSDGFGGFANGIKGITPEVNSLGTALDYVANADWFEKVKGSAGDLPAVTKQVQDVDAALSKMDPAAAQTAFAKVRAEVDPTKVSLEQLVAQFPQYKAALQSQAEAMGVTNLTNAEYADWMGGKIPSAIANATKAQPGYQAATKDSAADTAAATAALDKQIKSLEAQTKAMFDSANAVIGLSDAHIGFEQAIDDASDALKKNGKNIDDNTAKGRANNSSLNNLAASGLRYVQQLGEQNASTKTVTQATQRARDEFVATAVKMGYTKEAAGRLADSYGLIPKKVATSVSAPGAAEAKAKADAFHKAVRELPKSEQTRINSIFKRQGIDAANRELNKINGKTATTYINTVHTSTTQSGGKPRQHVQYQAQADGGEIYGPYIGPTADNVLIHATPREWMMPVASRDYYGAHLMSAIQYRQIPREQLLGFAGGGEIPYRTPVSSPFAPLTTSAPAQIDNSRTYQFGDVGYDPAGIVRAIQAEERLDQFRSNLIPV